jgi:hypothetical protein
MASVTVLDFSIGPTYLVNPRVASPALEHSQLRAVRRGCFGQGVIPDIGYPRAMMVRGKRPNSAGFAVLLAAEANTPWVQHESARWRCLDELI